MVHHGRAPHLAWAVPHVWAGQAAGASFTAVSYLQVPLLGTGLLFLLFFPGIIGQGSQTYLDATGLTQEPYLDRWLLITAAMFLISAVLYAARVAYTHRESSS